MCARIVSCARGFSFQPPNHNGLRLSPERLGESQPIEMALRESREITGLAGELAIGLRNLAAQCASRGEREESESTEWTRLTELDLDPVR
jgi:hypothetical protein